MSMPPPDVGRLATQWLEVFTYVGLLLLVAVRTLPRPWRRRSEWDRK